MAYKILSLDGGGSWSLIQARVLLDLYGDISGHSLLQKFDMVISNSGGSLVLACLCNDMKLSATIEAFENAQFRKEIFSRLMLFEKLQPKHMMALLRSIIGIGPKYSAPRKLKSIRSVFRHKDHLYEEEKIKQPIIDTTLDELPAIIGHPELQIIIVGFDYLRERVSFFRSNRLSRTDKFSSRYFAMTLAYAIHASSNAPVNYFDDAAITRPSVMWPKPGFGHKPHSQTMWYWDGAVSGFNNPVLAGLIEAITNDAPLRDICILSLGTGVGSKAILSDKLTSDDPEDKALCKINEDNKLVEMRTSFAFVSDVKKMSTSILDDPPDSATFIAYSIMDPSLTNTANLVRINPCYSPVLDNTTKKYQVPEVYKNDPDAETKLLNLLDLDMDAVEDYEVKMISDLCNKFITDQQPCLANQLVRGEPDTEYLGHLTYAAAKQKWKECM